MGSVAVSAALEAPERHRRPLRVAVFTTSYPRSDDDFSGRFVHGTVANLRARGLEVEVVGPGSYRDFGLTANNGAGLIGNLKRRPWLAPFVLLSMIFALRSASKRADLVHTNWLAGAVVAAFCGKPFVVTLHGSPTAGRLHDLGLAASAPRLVRWILGRARSVICCSELLATARRGCGLTNVRAIPYGVHVPNEVGDEDEPASVLYVGRLSPEKNIDVIAGATEGLPRIIAGDGPLRDLLHDTIGFVRPRGRSRRRVVCRRSAERGARGDGAWKDRHRDAGRRDSDRDRRRQDRPARSGSRHRSAACRDREGARRSGAPPPARPGGAQACRGLLLLEPRHGRHARGLRVGGAGSCARDRRSPGCSTRGRL